jgi:predicted transcriptional regulator
MNKEKLIATISDMPEDFDLEILMEKLIFIEKVEKGLDQLHSGNILTHEEVKQRIKQWQK